MTLALEPVPLPLTTDETGEVRLEGTRVPLQYIVYEYRNGATAEDIAVNYPSLKLPDIHAVLSYYLAHKAEVSRRNLIPRTVLADKHRVMNKGGIGARGVRP